MYKYLDLVLNKLPILSYFDGYKTIIAGSLAAVGCATSILAGVTNPETAEILIKVSEYANKGAGYLGVVGLCGKAVKK